MCLSSVFGAERTKYCAVSDGDGEFRILLFHDTNIYYYRIDKNHNNNDNRRRGRMFDGALRDSLALSSLS